MRLTFPQNVTLTSLEENCQAASRYFKSVFSFPRRTFRVIICQRMQKKTSRLRMVRINTDGILQTSIFWFYLSSWVNSSKQPLANSISSILNKGTMILSSQKFQIVRKSIDVQSLTKKRREQKKDITTKKKKVGGGGGGGGKGGRRLRSRTNAE